MYKTNVSVQRHKDTVLDAIHWSICLLNQSLKKERIFYLRLKENLWYFIIIIIIIGKTLNTPENSLDIWRLMNFKTARPTIN